MRKTPNIVFVFGDQWRQQATGYAGNPQVRTPNLDRLAEESLVFQTAVSNCPVCSPWRASLMTGQYPLTHGVFVNDVPVSGSPRYLAECFREVGYDTAYIGKWHIDGHGRKACIPPERRKGFDYWKVLECTHSYNHSLYYADGPELLEREGYDAAAQTRDACGYIRSHRREKPFLLMLSWGPPHNPFETAPERFRAMYEADAIGLRPNVPADQADRARRDLAGYYAHCTALDACMGEIMEALEAAEHADHTILVFTSDHGDMLGSQGYHRKQRPWDESIMVPMLLRYPDGFGRQRRDITCPIGTPDLMPTLLGLAGLDIPASVEGSDFASFLRQDGPPPSTRVLIELPACFHEFTYRNGGRDWRGLRTERYTYVIDHDGPWLFYDNMADPCQLTNRIDDPSCAHIRESLDTELRRRLAERGDAFKHGRDLIDEYGFKKNDECALRASREQ